MRFSQPVWLLLLLVVAGLGVGYLLVLARRRRDTVRFTALELLEKVVPRTPGWPKHVPTAGILLALVLLTIGLAGPTAEGRVPRNRATVVLVIDVSLSMMASDVAPSRLAAAQAAAKTFVDDLPETINLGLVAFAGTAAVLVSPGTDRVPVQHAIDTLRLSESTPTGEAIFAALQSVETFSGSLPGDREGPPPAHVVVMSDGKQTVPGGEDAENQPRGAFTAARAAADSQVPVSTIAFGTVYGSIDLDGEQIPVAVDEPSMREVARLAGGESFSATSEGELRNVYAALGEEIGYETKQVDVSKPWLAGGTLATMAGLGSAFAFGRRIP
ncbi:VWA domain-containing protein [Pseudonocardia sichuanensis]|uniref:VWA domain-containing protein n=1 Tax=Pseudonocardia sp. MH-G8 TaxID=1854588 RepID=UPI000BA074FB|nr:VWA domain-containing protein [Pseudonocardia sp. MH-G8]OZM80027.1 hypothetical protein CFP66_22620 [Pseudonocardia sp. MH-G8]